MRGGSHLGMNMATGIIVAETCFLTTKISSPEWLQTGVTVFSEFMLDGGDVPKIIFIPAVIILFLIGGLLPDIDTPYSMLGRIIYIPVEHRTWTHAIWWPLIFCIAGIWVRPFMWLGLGIFMHDLWDHPSASGINWFYPKKRKKKHKFKLYHTGKASEYIIVGSFWTLMILYSLLVAQLVYHVFDFLLQR